MKHILLITPTSNQVITFRKNLINDLLSRGYKVSVLTFDEKYKDESIKLGVSFNCVSGENRSVNPFKVLSLKNKYAKVIKEINPDTVFTFMVKPNTFGVLASKKAGVKKIFSMVEGTGDPFTCKGLKWTVIRFIVCFLYRRSFKCVNKVFFLNNDDKAEFIERKLVKENKCLMVHGIGVDLNRFEFTPIENDKTFIMIARMLKTKGVYEYFECAKLVKEKYPDATFNYLGAEGTVKLSELKDYIDKGIVNYLGTTDDVRPFIKEATALILPTYKEGMPVTVMESSAMGRPIIATDTNGCRDAVVEGETGYLVKVGDSKALSEKVIALIENKDRVEKMGKNARVFAEKHFDMQEINRTIIGVIEDE